MRLLIHREKREVVDGRVRVVSKEKQYLVDNPEKDFNTFYGKIAKADLMRPSGSVIKTDKGKEFIILDADFTDVWREFRKLPQTVPLKDIGFIVAETGLNPESIVVEGGLGSGALAAGLARVAKQVTSYEVREDHIKIAESNLKSANISNVTVKNQSLYEGIDESDVDAIIIDVPEPWQVIPHALNSLKIGGFFVSYVPTIVQVQQFVEEIKKHGQFMVLKTVELIERPWLVDGKRVRPDNTAIGHSGFVTVVRKIKA